MVNNLNASSVLSVDTYINNTLFNKNTANDSKFSLFSNIVCIVLIAFAIFDTDIFVSS